VTTEYSEDSATLDISNSLEIMLSQTLSTFQYTFEGSFSQCFLHINYILVTAEHFSISTPIFLVANFGIKSKPPTFVGGGLLSLKITQKSQPF